MKGQDIQDETDLYELSASTIPDEDMEDRIDYDFSVGSVGHEQSLEDDSEMESTLRIPHTETAVPPSDSGEEGEEVDTSEDLSRTLGNSTNSAQLSEAHSGEVAARRQLSLASMDVELLRVGMLNNLKRFNENMDGRVKDGSASPTTNIDNDAKDEVVELQTQTMQTQTMQNSSGLRIGFGSSMDSIYGYDDSEFSEEESENHSGLTSRANSFMTENTESDIQTSTPHAHPSLKTVRSERTMKELRVVKDKKEKEEERLKRSHQRSPNTILNMIQKLKDPGSIASTALHCIIIVIFLYNIIIIPFRVCFTFFLEESLWLIVALGVIDVAVDIWSFVDIGLNFLTPYTTKVGELAYNPSFTSVHYLLSGMFWVDLLSSIPLDWFIMIPLTRYIPLFRLNRLTRLARYRYYLSAIERVSSLTSSEILAAESVLIVVYMTHLCACVMHLILVMGTEEAGIDFTQVEPFFEFSIFSRYVYTVGWAAGTLTGFSGTQPITTPQLLFTLTVVFIGFSLFVVVIGTVGSVVSDMDSKSTELKQKVDTIDQYLRYRGTSFKLRQKIRDYYNFLHRARNGWDEDEILGDMPLYLRMEVAMDMNRVIIERVPLFQAAKENRMFISSLVTSLVPRVMLPNTIIVKQGDIAQEMFFISSGTVEIVLEDGTVVATLPSGSFFGEIALLHNSRRTASVRSATYIDLFILTKHSFDAIAEDFPDAIEAIRREAESRVKSNKHDSKPKMELKSHRSSVDISPLASSGSAVLSS